MLLMRTRILVVENDKELLQFLSALLMAEGVEAELAGDGETGIARACSGEFDLIILGTALPHRSGFSVCRELRQTGVDTSILMLSARTRVEERVMALRLGADDCVPRSCDPNELMARVEALLRRVPRAIRGPLRIARFGDVEIDFTVAEVRKSGRTVRLSDKELRLLKYLVEHREKVVSRKELLSNVWEYDSAVSSRTIDVHVGWLRQKLEDNPQRPRYIKTIRCRGYRFDRDEPALTSVVSFESTKLVIPFTES